jgi:PAS domain S-box-containing protein
MFMTAMDHLMDLFERTPDLVCIVNKAGWFIEINQAVVNTLGFSQQELLEHPVSNFIHPDDRERTGKRRAELLSEKPLLNFRNRYVNKAGEIVWLEWTSVYVPEKEVVFAIAKNITVRKEAELKIEENFRKYKELATHFKNHIEKDRRLFAAELHEELAQLATAVKMELDWIAARPGEKDQLREDRIEHALALSQVLIDKIRSISYSINPVEISESGLKPALERLCMEFESLSDVPCNFQSHFHENQLGYEAKLDLFRICQEALLNVLHHAQATEVLVLIEEKEGAVELSITDNGKGFEVKTSKNSGLSNMRVRAASIDGAFSIESNLSRGTRVGISVEANKDPA